MDTAEFANILYNTVVPSSLSEAEEFKKYEPIQNYVASQLPSKLYRFRRCDERSISAFYNDQIWVSTSESMNDGFDARLYFDKHEIISWLDSQLSDDSLNAFINSIGADSKLPPNIAVLPGIEQAYQQIKTLSHEQLMLSLKNIYEFIRCDSSEAIAKIAALTQQTLKFCCLSEKIESSAMWGLYAADESGFALAYDCRNISESISDTNGSSRQCTIFPVIYGEERFKVPTEYIQFLLTYRLWNIALGKTGYISFCPAIAQWILGSLVCPDKFIATKIALHKSAEWQNEKEWRLFCSSSNDMEFQQANHGFFIKAPVALYLGRRISPIHEKILRNFALEKNLPVFKMRLNDESATYELKPSEI